MPETPKLTITTEEWLQSTSVANTLRSAKLKQVDKALEQYNQGNQSEKLFTKLRDAFQRWERSRKSEAPSQRDGAGYVTLLRTQINSIEESRDSRFSPEDKKALDFIRSQRTEAINKIFEGKSLIWRNQLQTIIKEGLHASKELKSAAENMNEALDGKGKPSNSESDAIASSTVKSMFGDMEPRQLFASMGLEEVTLFEESAKALFSQFSDPARLVKSLGSAAKKMWVANQIDRTVFAPGDPETAIKAVQTLLKSELKVAAIDVAKTSAKIVADVASGGLAVPLTAAATSMVNVLLTMSRAANDYKQMEMGKKRLEEGNVDMYAFQDCPILGCHYLMVAGDSVVLDWHTSDLGSESFDKTILDLKKKTGPAIESARQYIGDARYVVADQSQPGDDWLQEASADISKWMDGAKTKWKARFERDPKKSNEDFENDDDDPMDRLLPLDVDRSDPGASDLSKIAGDHASIHITNDGGDVSGSHGTEEDIDQEPTPEKEHVDGHR